MCVCIYNFISINVLYNIYIFIPSLLIIGIIRRELIYMTCDILICCYYYILLLWVLTMVCPAFITKDKIIIFWKSKNNLISYSKSIQPRSKIHNEYFYKLKLYKVTWLYYYYKWF